jgi:F0F1-type ATP synthase assembly protein I
MDIDNKMESMLIYRDISMLLGLIIGYILFFTPVGLIIFILIMIPVNVISTLFKSSK